MDTSLTPAASTPDRQLQPCLAVAVTLRTHGGQPVFRHTVFARHCVDFLRALATMTGTRIHAYRILPDRVHLLLAPPPVSSIERYVGRWRALCAREWQRRTGKTPLWQAGLEARRIADPRELHRARRHFHDDVDEPGE